MASEIDDDVTNLSASERLLLLALTRDVPGPLSIPLHKEDTARALAARGLLVLVVEHEIVDGAPEGFLWGRLTARGLATARSIP